MAQDGASDNPNPTVATNGSLSDKATQQSPPDTSTPAPQTSSQADSSNSAITSVESTNAETASKGTPASSGKASAAQSEDEFRIPTDGPLKVPIPKPLPQSKIPPTAALTGEQESKYATLLSKVSAWQTLPESTARKATQKPLSDAEHMWLTRECLLRYLRATKWNVAQALSRLQNTLTWRREYGADTFTFAYISPENETGKQVILGYDNDARPCLYLNPGKQNTEMSDRQIHHLCFMLDRTIDMMPPGQENAALLINFAGASSGKIPTVGQARAVLNILQNHNPERLGKALISETPWYVNTFFKLISPFIDPVTREKMKFNVPLPSYVPKANLWNQYEGELNFVYDHAAYWSALEAEVTRRREAMRERWEKGGKRIGEYEEYLRGGDRLSLQQEIDGYEPTPDVSRVNSEADLLTNGVEKMAVNE